MKLIGCEMELQRLYFVAGNRRSRVVYFRGGRWQEIEKATSMPVIHPLSHPRIEKVITFYSNIVSYPCIIPFLFDSWFWFQMVELCSKFIQSLLSHFFFQSGALKKLPVWKSGPGSESRTGAETRRESLNPQGRAHQCFERRRALCCFGVKNGENTGAI